MNKILSAVLIAGLLTVSSSYGVTTAGRVAFATGTPEAIDESGGQRVLIKDGEIHSGDTIYTKQGVLHVKFTDGAFMSFDPNTHFQIEDYQFNGKQDGSEKGNYYLKKGGLRTVTGLIGKKNRKAYSLRTSVATIGIRGTKFYVKLLDGGLLIHMGEDGAIEVNDGNRVLFLTAFEVSSIGGKDAVFDQIKSGGIDSLGPIGEFKIPGGGTVIDYAAGDEVNSSGESKGVSSGIVIPQTPPPTQPPPTQPPPSQIPW
ncbi:MAG: FecR domain-containing protein [Gammaproteobacteria bacterium]|nr:FecR domain-containing protein [Gammaproteobacteria bacterium]